MTNYDSWLTPNEYALIHAQDGDLFNFQAAIGGKSPETQRKYRDWLWHFYQDVLGITIEDFSQVPIRIFVSQVTPAAVEAWLSRYAADDHSKSGLGQARATVALMARMLVLSRQAPSTLWHDLRLVRLPDHAASATYGESVGERGARWLTPEEVRIVINTARAQPKVARAHRDASLIWLMVTLGLRRDEVANLQWENLSRRGDQWTLRIRGKRNKWRAVGVPPETIIALQPWAQLLTGGQKVFPTGFLLRRVLKSGKIPNAGITGNAVWRIVTDVWAETGLHGDLAPHDLRRTAAAIALDAGATDREIQQILGHSSIETTHRYLAPLRENTATYRIAQMISADNGFFDVTG
jgi:integrase